MIAAPAGSVLAGGASRRMGTDKAFVEVGGTAMAARVAAALRAGGCTPVWCQGGDPERLARLGLVAHPDSRPGDGPVPAILDALGRAAAIGAGGVVVAAVDLPQLTAEAIRAVAAGDAHVAALTVAGRPQLVSWWPVGAVGPLAALVARGVRRYWEALEGVGWLGVEVDPAAVRNVNRPGDVATGDPTPARRRSVRHVSDTTGASHDR